MAAILTLDIETMPAIVETWDLYPNYLPIDMVLVPTRILCFSAKWYEKKPVIFHAAWDDDDADSHAAMIRAAWGLLDAADVVVGVNSDRFDLQHLNAAFGRLGLGPPAPYRSLDLQKLAKKHFKRGEMSMKLDWFARQWLDDRKVKHDGIELWQQIRRGTAAEKLKAQRTMTRYNIKDVRLTEQLFERFLPWTGINFSIYDRDNAELSACPKCESSNIHKRGLFFTTAYAFQRYRCMDCGSWSRGRRSVYTTELRPVA